MDRIIAGTGAAVRRWRTLAGIAIAVLAVALGAAAASAASKPGLSLKAKHTIINYKKSATLTGTLSTGKKGVLVKLQDRVWPFKGSFKTVAKTHTRAHGAFSFSQRPSLATKYRAVAPKGHAKSASRTVYVVKAFKVLRCVLTGRGHTYPGCTNSNTAPPGKYTWRITLEFVYPASVVGREKSKPVYTYFGETFGSETTPKTLKRGTTDRQHLRGKSSTVVKFAKRVTVPHKAYFMEANFCTKTTERKDGFGLPGAPGSHMCGAKTIPGKASVNKLG